MKTHLLLFTLFTLTACAQEQADNPTDTSPLPSNVVARINGTDIPTEWFLHEFRSSFFKHMQEDNVRTATLEPFLKRMILTERARQVGIADQPEVQQEIKRRIDGMRAYMEYQLDMAEIGIINQALIEHLGLARSPDEVTPEELKLFFDENIKGQDGAPDSISNLPPQALDSIKKQIIMAATEQQLEALIEEWKSEMTLQINDRAVQSIPFPEMKGNPPPSR